MAGTKVATRYAKSFLGLASEKGKLDEALNDMELIKRTTLENRELLMLLKSPVVKTDKKVSILQQIYGKKISEISMLFINLITKNRRERFLLEISDAFVAQYKELKGITSAVVTSATELSEEAKKRIQTIVQQEIGGTVELQAEVNPDLIGGFVLRIGDKQLDTSVQNKVNKLKREFGNDF